MSCGPISRKEREGAKLELRPVRLRRVSDVVGVVMMMPVMMDRGE